MRDGYALVLNSSFEPLNIVTWKRALRLYHRGKAEIVENSDRYISTIRQTYRVPSVLRLVKYVPVRKIRKVIRFSRENVFARDDFKCQYCVKKLPKAELTLDHVQPLSKGGLKTWDNIVTACKPCNQKKGSRTPQQASMNIQRNPEEPRWLPQISFQSMSSVLPSSWKSYLGMINSPNDGTPSPPETVNFLEGLSL